MKVRISLGDGDLHSRRRGADKSSGGDRRRRDWNETGGASMHANMTLDGNHAYQASETNGRKTDWTLEEREREEDTHRNRSTSCSHSFEEVLLESSNTRRKTWYICAQELCESQFAQVILVHLTPCFMMIVLGNSSGRQFIIRRLMATSSLPNSGSHRQSLTDLPYCDSPAH